MSIQKSERCSSQCAFGIEIGENNLYDLKFFYRLTTFYKRIQGQKIYIHTSYIVFFIIPDSYKKSVIGNSWSGSTFNRSRQASILSTLPTKLQNGSTRAYSLYWTSSFGHRDCDCYYNLCSWFSSLCQLWILQVYINIRGLFCNVDYFSLILTFPKWKRTDKFNLYVIVNLQFY